MAASGVESGIRRAECSWSIKCCLTCHTCCPSSPPPLQVRAYGTSPVLRDLANLVLVMGNRDIISSMAPGSQSVLDQVLKMIDAYDLYGSVAYPKRHKQSDISDIYLLPAATRGVFVNIALQVRRRLDPLLVSQSRRSAAALHATASIPPAPCACCSRHFFTAHHTSHSMLPPAHPPSLHTCNPTPLHSTDITPSLLPPYSSQEPFGLTLIEAAAHGVPIVATTHGGPVDIIGTLHNGILVEPTDVGQVQGALLRMLTNAQLWDSYSCNGCTNIGAYSWPSHCSRWVAWGLPLWLS